MATQVAAIKPKTYTVKLEFLRVVAWSIQRDSEYGSIFMEPITLPLHPSETNGSYVQITEDDNFKSKTKPWTVMSVIPAAGTSQVFLVLYEHGKPAYNVNEQRVDYELGFHTLGTDFDGWFEEQRQAAKLATGNSFRGTSRLSSARRTWTRIQRSDCGEPSVEVACFLPEQRTDRQKHRRQKAPRTITVMSIKSCGREVRETRDHNFPAG